MSFYPHEHIPQHDCHVDLARCIAPVPDGLNLDFIRASSYHGTSTSSSGEVDVVATQKIPIKGRNVLLVRVRAQNTTGPQCVAQKNPGH